MSIYWTLKQVPEMRGLSQAQRGRVHRACYPSAFRSGRCLLALAACGACGGGGSLLGGTIHLLLGTTLSIWHVIVGCGLGGGIGGFIFSQTVTSYLRPFYADYINRNRSELG